MEVEPGPETTKTLNKETKVTGGQDTNATSTAEIPLPQREDDDDDDETPSQYQRKILANWGWYEKKGGFLTQGGTLCQEDIVPEVTFTVEDDEGA